MPQWLQERAWILHLYVHLPVLYFFCQDSRLIIIIITEVSPRNLRITPSVRRTESIKKKPQESQGSVLWCPPRERGFCGWSSLPLRLQYALTAAKLAKLFGVTPQIMKERSSLEDRKLVARTSEVEW